MFGDRHELHTEFPEHAELIRQLHRSDEAFAALLDEYTALDEEIYEIEESGTNVSDEHAEELKFRRVALKDKLYGMLQQNAS